MTKTQKRVHIEVGDRTFDAADTDGLYAALTGLSRGEVSPSAKVRLFELEDDGDLTLYPEVLR